MDRGAWWATVRRVTELDMTGHESQEIASVQFSRSVVSNSLRPYGL